MPIIMQDVMYVPDGRYNLFSITKMIKGGWKLQGSMDEGITLTKDDKEIYFRQKVHTTKGVLFVACIRRRQTKGTQRTKGHISLLGHGPGVSFRNFRVKEVK